VDRPDQHVTQRKGTIGFGDFVNKPSEMSKKTGFRIPILSMVHVTSLSSAVYLAMLPFYGLASMVQEYGSTEGIMTGNSSNYYEKTRPYLYLASHKPHTNSSVGLGAGGGGGEEEEVISIQTT
jgi:hypothetical protein